MKQNPEEYDRLKLLLDYLQELEKKGYIDVFYGDESGFSLTPSVPYAWQKIGETIEVPTASSKRLNVLGFMNKNGRFIHYSTDKHVNSEYIINCIDDFCDKVNSPTVIVLDNAPIHKSKAFKAKMTEWEERGVRVFFLPRYSPHLNKIETLWRKIKYEWLDFNAFQSFEKLKESLDDVLDSINTKFTINFA
jgi:transposase